MMNTASQEKPSVVRGVWSPKALVVCAILFSIFPSLIMFALNYGRYGLPRKRTLWIVVAILAFVLMRAWDLISPDWAWHRTFMLTFATVWILYIKQLSLYRQWIAHGKRKASAWSGLLICLVFIVLNLGLNAASMLIPQDDYVAYELIHNGQYEDAERVLVESRQEYPDDLDVRYNLAVVYSETERTAMAVQELRAILKSDPHHEDAREFLHELEHQAGPEEGTEPDIGPVSSEAAPSASPDEPSM